MQVITIYVDAKEESDLKKAADIAADRIVEYDPSILVLDTQVDEVVETTIVLGTPLEDVT